MPKITKESFGFRDRTYFDGQPGRVEIVPTSQRYVEEDGTDVRVRRVKFYNAAGVIDHSYMCDEMGVPFVDEAQIPDDLNYLDSLQD